MGKHSSSSSSDEYYYIEDEVSVGRMKNYINDPTVVEIKRINGKGAVGSTVKGAGSKTGATAGTAKKSKKGKSCKKACICGWLLALIFLGLFIGFLVAYLSKSDEIDGITTTMTTTTVEVGSVEGGWNGEWPASASPWAAMTQENKDAEDMFIEDILVELSLQEKVAQMIQPALNQSESELTNAVAGALKFGPGDQGMYGFGSMLNGGGGWPDAAMNYHNGNGDIFACPGCVGFKSEPRAYARMMEEYHIKNEQYWDTRTAPAGAPGNKVRIPWMYATDAVHGHNNVLGATMFPHNIGLGAMHNVQLMGDIGSATAREVAATAMDWTFAPAVSVPRFDTWGRVYEGYSENPRIVHDYSGRMVQGIQGTTQDEFQSDNKVISNIKHWIGDGGTEFGVDRGDNKYTESDLINIHGPGYFSGLAAGAQVVMVSFNSWNNVANYDPTPYDGTEFNGKLHGSQYMIQDVLKDKMGFDGLVVTDWLGHTEISGCSETSCHQLINAGVDIVMLPGKNSFRTFMDDVVEAVNNDRIPLTRVDDAVRRILRVKYRAGLWKKDSPLGVACHKPDAATGLCTEQCAFTDVTGLTVDWEVAADASGDKCGRNLAGDETILQSQEHFSLARQAVSESLVLLKNKDAALPLPDTAINVGIIGSAAMDWAKINGGWTITWQGGIADGVNTAIGGDFNFVMHPSESINEHVTSNGGSVKNECTSDMDYCILMIGEDPYAEMVGDIQKSSNMEFRSIKPSYATDCNALADARVIANNSTNPNGTKIITLFFSGRSLYVNEEINNSDAFIAAWLPGSAAGPGIADVLFNKEDFSGILPRTWPKAKCHWNVNSKPGTCPEEWKAPHFERTYEDVVAADEPSPFEYKFGLTYASTEDEIVATSAEIPLDDRRYGCLVEDPTLPNRFVPTEAYDAMDADMLCSVYQSQYDNTYMQIECDCFGASPGADCPVANPTYSSKFDVSVGSGGELKFKTVSSKNELIGGQVFFRNTENVDAHSHYYADNSMVMVTLEKMQELAHNNPTIDPIAVGYPAIGLGVSFRDGASAFEMSDRTMLDVSTIINGLPLSATAGTMTRNICIPMTCMNGGTMGRNWYELAQPMIFETRGVVEIDIHQVMYVNPLTQINGTTFDSLTMCDVVLDDTCANTTLYPSYVDWHARAY